jgi:FtsZ-interacting cell division protein ZipA
MVIGPTAGLFVCPVDYGQPDLVNDLLRAVPDEYEPKTGKATMSTVLIVVALIVLFVIIVGAVLYAGPGRGSGRSGLKRRFGPEYDRVVTRHDGDTKAAEHELTGRVQRHGDLKPQALSEEKREQYVAQWAGLQERFVDSPREAVAEAEQLLARLAGERGYPDGAQYDDQLEALSVHHAHQVDGYRRVHHAVSEDGRSASTEELREAMVGARELFEQLILAHPRDDGQGRPGSAGRIRNISLRPKGSGA